MNFRRTNCQVALPIMLLAITVVLFASLVPVSAEPLEAHTIKANSERFEPNRIIVEPSEHLVVAAAGDAREEVALAPVLIMA